MTKKKIPEDVKNILQAGLDFWRKALDYLSELANAECPVCSTLQCEQCIFTYKKGLCQEIFDVSRQLYPLLEETVQVVNGLEEAHKKAGIYHKHPFKEEKE